MGPKGFLVNRPLSKFEREHHFEINQPASQKVHYDLSLIKLNSTFIECVDKWYSMRGFMAMAMTAFGLVMLYGLWAAISISIKHDDLFLAVVAVVPAVGASFMVRFFLLDAFTYTHYPIRFNRKNRQVYAFRRDGTVLKAGWEEFYWTIYKAEHVGGNQPASQKVHYDLSLIKLNSTFIECVDKWYSMRGFVAMAGSVFATILIVVMILALYAVVTSGFLGYLLLFPVALVFVWLPLKMLFSDAFTYTHYPIRFNRKNRQVYAFRRDGTVLKAGWADFYWTIYNTKLGLGGGDLNVMGHLLDKDGVKVKESIGLSLVDAGESGKQNQLMFFEFFRRYMEQGPEPVLEALKPMPLIMLPGIDHEKESWFFGWELLTASLKGMPVLQLLLQVFFLPISLFRWLVMRTSKIPQWPQWVEDECRIEPGDPWERDGRHRA
ncbi:MAG: hypothetical protein C4K60_03460 [Ideonella sp. MAG2]|nr:MAG: hypothetical protein C4K60_03460 [Ideonella sp. MAG2]